MFIGHGKIFHPTKGFIPADPKTDVLSEIFDSVKKGDQKLRDDILKSIQDEHKLKRIEERGSCTNNTLMRQGEYVYSIRQWDNNKVQCLIELLIPKDNVDWQLSVINGTLSLPVEVAMYNGKKHILFYEVFITIAKIQQFKIVVDNAIYKVPRAFLHFYKNSFSVDTTIARKSFIEVDLLKRHCITPDDDPYVFVSD